MDQMTIAQLQQFAQQQRAAEQRLGANEDAITDMVARVVSPPVSRLQDAESAVQSMQGRLVEPGYDRLRQNDRRMNKIRVKLAGAASQRTMENQAVLTGQLARLSTAGFPGGSGTIPIQGRNPTVTGVGTGQQGPAIGPVYPPIGAQAVQPYGTAPASAAGPIGPGMGSGASSPLPNMMAPSGMSPNESYGYDPTLFPPVSTEAPLVAASVASPAKLPTDAYIPTGYEVPTPGGVLSGQVWQQSAEMPSYPEAPPVQAPSASVPLPPLPPPPVQVAPLPSCDPCELVRWAVERLCACLTAQRQPTADQAPQQADSEPATGGIGAGLLEGLRWYDAPQQALIDDAFAQGPPTGGAESGGFNPELFGD